MDLRLSAAYEHGLSAYTSALEQFLLMTVFHLAISEHFVADHVSLSDAAGLQQSFCISALAAAAAA